MKERRSESLEHESGKLGFSTTNEEKHVIISLVAAVSERVQFDLQSSATNKIFRY